MKYILGDIFVGNFPVSQKYGVNPDYYKQVSRGTITRGHEGVDWATPTGTPILAPFNGIIVRDNITDKIYGKLIVLWDPLQKCAVWFCHLDREVVNYGQEVKRGDILGYTGNTGNSTNSHLHLNFCETDAQGYRINQNNGSLGFLNVLDPNLVKWELGNTKTAQVQEVTFTIPYGEKSEDYMVLKKSDFTQMRTKCDYYDPLLNAGYGMLENVDRKIDSVRGEYAGQIQTLKNENKKLKEDILEIQSQAVSMADLYKKQGETDLNALSRGIEDEKLVEQLQGSIKQIADYVHASPDIRDIISRVDNLMQNQKSSLEKTIDNLEEFNQNTWGGFLNRLGLKGGVTNGK